MLQERPVAVGINVPIPWGAGTGCRALQGWLETQGTARALAPCGQHWCGLGNGCGHVPCANQGKRLHPGSCSVGSYCNISAEQHGMGKVAQGQAASSACCPSGSLCPPLSHHQVRVKYFPLLHPYRVFSPSWSEIAMGWERAICGGRLGRRNGRRNARSSQTSVPAAVRPPQLLS